MDVYRHWKLPQHACTIGMLCKDVKIRLTGKEKKRSALVVLKRQDLIKIS